MPSQSTSEIKWCILGKSVECTCIKLWFTNWIALTITLEAKFKTYMVTKTKTRKILNILKKIYLVKV